MGIQIKRIIVSLMAVYFLVSLTAAAAVVDEFGSNKATTANTKTGRHDVNPSKNSDFF